MNMNVLEARAEFYDLAVTSRELVAYFREHRIDPLAVMPYAGGTALLPVWDCGAGRFDFAPHLHAPDQPVSAFVCEALHVDGQTTIDFVAWPVDQPTRVLTMFGTAPAVGLWEAGNPATYYLGKSLVVHRTPLAWLEAGCRGAALVNRQLAGRWLLDLAGPVAARDEAHARDLVKLMSSVVDLSRVRVAVAEDERIAA